MSAGSFSIYDLNPEIKKLLNADNFLNGLSVNDFVEEISKDHILKGAEVNKKAYLDLNHTFDHLKAQLEN